MNKSFKNIWWLRITFVPCVKTREMNEALPIRFWCQIGVVREATAEWKLFRCRAEKPHMKDKFILACQMLNSGEYSMRQVSLRTGYAKNTVCNLLKKLLAFRQKNGMGDIKCPCGVPLAVHRGWCKFRYEQSDSRKKYWESHLKKQKNERKKSNR